MHGPDKHYNTATKHTIIIMRCYSSTYMHTHVLHTTHILVQGYGPGVCVCACMHACGQWLTILWILDTQLRICLVSYLPWSLDICMHACILTIALSLVATTERGLEFHVGNTLAMNIVNLVSVGYLNYYRYRHVV